MIDYYAEHLSGSDPFSWEKAYPLVKSEIIKKLYFWSFWARDTFLLMAMAPDGIEIERTSGKTVVNTLDT